MELSKQDIAKLAELSRLNLSEEESDRYQKTLGDILVHVDRLQEYMEGKSVRMDRDVLGNRAELRSDESAKPCTTQKRDALLKSARDVKDNLVVVPGVFDRSEK